MSQHLTIKIVTIGSEIILESQIDSFTIETLITSPKLDFYNSVFRLLHNF
jgi:hypothetical protein